MLTRKDDVTRKHNVTTEELKKYAFFKNFSDQEAEEALETIRTFIRIVLDQQQNIKENIDI